MKGTVYLDGAYLAQQQQRSKNAKKKAFFLLTKVTDTFKTHALNT